MHLLLVLGHLLDFRLKDAAEGNDRLPTMCLHPGMDLRQPLRLFADEGLFCQVDQVHNRLAADQRIGIEKIHLLVVPVAKSACAGLPEHGDQHLNAAPDRQMQHDVTHQIQLSMSANRHGDVQAWSIS